MTRLSLVFVALIKDNITTLRMCLPPREDSMDKSRVSEKLDWSRMLGFEQITEVRESFRHEAPGGLGAKVGTKTGSKVGEKVGVKLGQKVGVKLGVKRGLKA